MFRTRERSKLEEIAIKIIAIIDIEKTNALLGKTDNASIVRKRQVTITTKNSDEALQLTTEVNLAKDEESRYSSVPKKEKSLSLSGLQSFFYECS